MDDIFMVLLLISMLAIPVFGIMSIIAFVKKNGAKGKKMLTFCGISIIVMIISFVGVGTTTDTKESTDKDKLETTAKTETPEEKAEREAKETAEKAKDEKKAKEEAEAKAKAEEEARIQAEQAAQSRKQEAVANSQSITFPMLNKAADRYTGKPYYLKGEVVQAIEDGNYTIMRINMTQESWGWTDTVWVEYANITDAVEGSIVEIYGEIYGSHTYDTAIGGQMTLPAIMAEEVIVLQ